MIPAFSVNFVANMYTVIFVASSLAVLSSTLVLPIVDSFLPPPLCCKGKTYFPFNGLCCNDVFFERNFSEPLKACCGSKTYLVNKELCCNDEIVENTEFPDNGGCCDGKPFDGNVDLCCGKTLHTGSAGSMCCGEMAYDYNQKRCIDGETKEIPTEIENPIFCEGEFHDINKVLCCKNKRVDRESKNHVCCTDSTIPYNALSQICCNGIVSERPKGSASCCEKLAYDSQTQICCDDQEAVIEKPETDPKNPVYYQCCGGQAYTSQNNLCCDGKIIDSPNYSLGCCGQNTFNYALEFCCGDKVYNNENVGNETSCCHDKINYDPQKNFCCQNGLKPRPEGADCLDGCYPNFPQFPGGPVSKKK